MPVPPGAGSNRTRTTGPRCVSPAHPTGVPPAQRSPAAADTDATLSTQRLRVIHPARSTTPTLRSCSRCCLGRRTPLLARAGSSVCFCAQGGLDEGQSPTSAQTCAYETTHCLPTTRTCNHPSCSLLVCDTCAQSMCPDGENENEYHWCAHHMPPTEQQDDEGDSDEDPFAFKAT